MSVFQNTLQTANSPTFRKFLIGIVIGVALGMMLFLRDKKEVGVKQDRDQFVQNRSDAKAPLAPGIPRDRIPDYTLNGFEFVSTDHNQKQWKLLAKKALMYNAEGIVHTIDVTAYLYDAQGATTVVTGLEGKYFMSQRGLEVFGQVHTVFPDGFEVNSEYLRYRPETKRIDIPESLPVAGHGRDSSGEREISFTSLGLDYAMRLKEMVLPKNAVVVVANLINGEPATEKTALKDSDHTQVESDRAVIYREKQIAKFTMSPARPLKSRFVQITQPTLLAQSRRAEMLFGPGAKSLDYLTLFDDAFIRELPKTPRPGQAVPTDPIPVRYGTGGRADFDATRDVIVLRDFPQVYQDQDTVTGEVIVVHRDSDIVEVEHSNAFSEGERRK